MKYVDLCVHADTHEVEMFIYIEAAEVTPAEARKILTKALGQLDKAEVKMKKLEAKFEAAKARSLSK